MTNYEQPQLEVFGAVEELTRFSQTPTRQDSVFRDGVVVDAAPNGIGSVDQCVFTGGAVTEGPAVCA